ncbi:MAG: hypothetical protein Q9227_000330 [Pyrenula ochraceoflavens]
MPHSEPASPSTESLPYWLVNVPKDEWPANPWDCPHYLCNLSEKNIQVLLTPDAAFQRQTWSDEFGSILRFILQFRLKWSSLSPTGAAKFEDPTDYKILYNDWPYGLDEDIVHLVVWTKFELEDDPKTGELICETRAVIEGFVDEVFCKRGKLPRANVGWFKNWRSIKSVHALEHFHVMLYKADARFLLEVTEGDVPMSKRLKA